MADVKEGSQEAEKVKRRRWTAREGCALRRLRISLEAESAWGEVAGGWCGDGVCVDSGRPASWGGRVCLIPPGLAAGHVG